MVGTLGLWGLLGCSTDSETSPDSETTVEVGQNAPSDLKPEAKDGESGQKSRELDLNQIVRMKRNSPVFSRPSSRSRILADTYADTVVILRKLSPKENWAQVEDEDGNKGWVPTNRTNWYEIKLEKTGNLKKNSGSAESPPPDTLPQNEEIANLPPDPPQSLKEDFEARGDLTAPSVTVLAATFSRKGRGLLAGYFSGSRFEKNGIQKIDRTGLEIELRNLWGAARVGTKDPWVVGAQFRMLTQGHNSGLAMGPGLGALFRFDTQKWGPQLNYSVGFLTVAETAPYVFMRSGFEWIDWDMEFQLGAEIGWAF